MRAVVLTKHGDPSVLQVQERTSPALEPGQVRIKVHAAGINFADTMARVGLYPSAPKPPCVLGYEVAGEIVEGDNTGARVIAGTRFGGYAEEVVVKAQDTFPLPDGLTFEQGAAIPVNYVTAYAALLRYGNLQPGEKVLLHAAAGGVGIAATQIAKHTGAEIWGTASPGKHDAIRGFGVDHAVDYTRKGWERDVPKLDLIMDAIGGQSFRRSYDLLNPGGRLVAFGASSVMDGEKRNLVAAAKAAVRMPRFNLIKQMTESKAVIGLNALALWDHAGTLGPWMQSLHELLDAGVIQPVVSDAVPFDNAGEAHRIITERRNVGKVVLVP